MHSLDAHYLLSTISVMTINEEDSSAVAERQEDSKVVSCKDLRCRGGCSPGLWYQALLQKNLMYLAAIADSQPQAPAMPTQISPHPAMQQGGFYIQHPQAAAMAQQPGMFPQKVPLQFNNSHAIQDHHLQQQLHQQHQQAIQRQMGMRSGAANNGKHGENTVGSGSGGVPPVTGNRQDAPEAGTSGADGQGSSAAGQGGGDGLRGSEEAK
ncbi:hypothetical protein RJ639_027353 [Escallonia herrerae]|uniref:GRF1-interacting factor 3 n=1 Tax=Escallonia herrerae TaxID=1293975 RepID=A0AA88X2L8_9ASTE|nr:hypothetical protein RJ639_027353 [Escallonia herrerae]